VGGQKERKDQSNDFDVWGNERTTASAMLKVKKKGGKGGLVFLQASVGVIPKKTTAPNGTSPKKKRTCPGATGTLQKGKIQEPTNLRVVTKSHSGEKTSPRTGGRERGGRGGNVGVVLRLEGTGSWVWGGWVLIKTDVLYGGGGKVRGGG